MKTHTFLKGALLALLLAQLTGCVTAVRQVVREAKGATGQVFPTRQVADGELDRFRGVTFDRCQTEVGERITPTALLLGYDAAAIRALESLKSNYPGGEPTLRVAASMLYFQKKSLMGGAEALARVRMYDGARALIDSVVRSESEAFGASDEDALAEAQVQAIAGFLTQKKSTPAQPVSASKARDSD